MSTTRLGRNWADVDEDEDDDVVIEDKSRSARCFETPVDEHGIKTVIEYKERDGKTYKVTKRVKQTTVVKWSNAEMAARKNLEKFGKAKTNDAATEASHITRSTEEVNIEIVKKQVILSQANDAEDKFLEEALRNCENLFKEKKVWTDLQKEKMLSDTTSDPTPAAAAAAPAPGAAPAAAAAPAPGGAAVPGKYVPPSLRTATGGKGDGKGKGDLQQQQEASLRVTNLSEDVKEGDLQELFAQFGRLQRVFLAKDMETHLCKGFAFVTYYTKEDAQKAMNKLNGHGYDNLILQVQFAKPRA